MRLIKFTHPVLAALILFLPLEINAQDATPVIITTVEKTDFADEIEALGTLRANETVDLTPSVTEIITEINFEDNQRVKKGDILIRMDAAEERAELAEQSSFVQEAQRQVDRLRPLVAQRAASAATLDENLLELDAAKSRKNAIQSRIDLRVIKAPFDGVLGLRNISVGALVQPGTLITTIDDDTIMKLDFTVPEIFLSSLKQGMTIEATSEAFPNRSFLGQIAFIESRIDPISRSIRARALIDNKDVVLKPGLLMRVKVHKNPRKTVLVPEEAIITNAAQSFVFVVKQEAEAARAEQREVTLGTRAYGVVEIIEGLEQGEKIVTHGTLRVRAGAPLTITAEEKIDTPLSSLLSPQKIITDRKENQDKNRKDPDQ